MGGNGRIIGLTLLVWVLLAPPVLAQPRTDGVQTGGQPGGMVLDRVVAVVNEEAVTLSEIQEEGQPVVRKIFQDFVGPELDRRLEEAQKQALDELIDRRLMFQVARREGMLPSSAEVSGAIEELKRNNNVTDDAQFRALLRSEGLTLEQIRRNLEERLAIGRLLARQVRSTIIISEEELVKYYESNQAKFTRVPTAEIRDIHIVAPPGGDEAAARARAEEAWAKLEAGADFGQVAREYSGSGSAGPDAEPLAVRRGDLAPEIEAVAFSLPAGGVSRPIKVGPGWHLIRVERVQVGPVTPFAEAREAIRDQVFQEKFEAKQKEWLASLRARAFIQVLVRASDLQAATRKP
jgi:peptidyl-prolyl cis-trans isomerase SurA